MIVAVDALLAASFAVTMMVLLPETKTILATDQDVVPDAVPELLLAEFFQVMAVTPTLSEAVPDMLMLDRVVA